MQNNIIYTDNGSLERLIKEKHIIPYKLSPNDKLKKGKWYYELAYNRLCKILELEYQDNGIIHHIITVSDEGYMSYIPEGLNNNTNYYIEFDKDKLYNDFIINSNKSYTGAEIRYWFFMNDIHGFDKKFREFWQYIDTYSKNRLNDKSKYFLKADYKNGIYINCKIIKDYKNIRKHYTQKEINKSIKYSAKEKIKDLHNTRKYHEDKMKIDPVG